MSDEYRLRKKEEVTPPAGSFDLNPESLVSVQQVTKRFGSKTALRDISFSVPTGQICGLLGPNGAGKTTLFRLLMGILKATYGKLLIDRRDAFEERGEGKRVIGFLSGEPGCYFYLFR